MINETICAKVNPRLLTKASRLFTGTVEGRIIEILQNARRAGATEVCINNQDGLVTVQDNGSGITDFQKLLDLGGSGWDENLEASEDPAGVGLFSLAPRQVQILSKSSGIVIQTEGWTGIPVEVTPSEEYIQGTRLIFQDDKTWDFETVEKHAVFTGMRVIVDNRECPQSPFCSQESADYEEFGCRIDVVPELGEYHRQWARSCYRSSVLVNFHGQVVQLDYWPGQQNREIHILIDLTAPTPIRLMLPARTRLVENEALTTLKEAIEIEYYRYFQHQKAHSLYYSEYLRAKELGIDLPEATPRYTVGLIQDEYGQAAELPEPKDFRLSEAYVCLDEDMEDEHGAVNVHLLAVLGRFKGKRFVPVTIHSGYRGYRWANLPKVASVKVSFGKERIRRMILAIDLVCVESLAISVQTSDGRTFESEVTMAVIDLKPEGKRRWHDEAVYVTEAVRKELEYDNLWYNLGGFNPEGDSYETQQYEVEQQLHEFWSRLVGLYEQLRHELVSQVNLQYGLYDKWQQVIITEDGSITLHLKDGTVKTIKRLEND